MNTSQQKAPVFKNPEGIIFLFDFMELRLEFDRAIVGSFSMLRWNFRFQLVNQAFCGIQRSLKCPLPLFLGNIHFRCCFQCVILLAFQDHLRSGQWNRLGFDCVNFLKDHLLLLVAHFPRRKFSGVPHWKPTAGAAG